VARHFDLVLLHAPSVYDFREKTILYGPVSDLVPPSPMFEMYPIGFTTIAEYLERHGYRVRLVNLAVRMLRDPKFDAEAMIRKLDTVAFGIDLHWLPHAHGAIEVARLVKKYHPRTPVILGGLSASYFHRELLDYPEVDYVVRGDSTEEPMRQLMAVLRRGDEPRDVPNVTWRARTGQVHENPFTYVPASLDNLAFDGSYVVRAVVRDRDLASYLPYQNWPGYPITAAFTCRGCTMGCVSCGGSAGAFSTCFQRTAPAYRSPELLARDVAAIGHFSGGPIFIIGDIRQPGDDYAAALLAALRRERIRNPVIIEFFRPVSREFMQQVAKALPKFTVEVSLESHDPEVRRAFGKPYGNEDIEASMQAILDAGAQRLDVFFIIGLPKQTFASVMETIDYCGSLLERFGRDEAPSRPPFRGVRRDGASDGRLAPFISPLAPFLDPGSQAFEHPEKLGYRLFYHTLEEHRQALVQPTWKRILNYETAWMTRDEIVAASYEAGLRLNRLKARYGLLDERTAAATEERILKARAMLEKIEAILAQGDPARQAEELRRLKPEVDQVSISTVCEKRELELPIGFLKLRLLEAFWHFIARPSLDLTGL
jgi:B12-binding domain/radical SAM domain protein